MMRLIEQGKIRHIGLSEAGIDEIAPKGVAAGLRYPEEAMAAVNR